jgi:hypothetical protein
MITWKVASKTASQALAVLRATPRSLARSVKLRSWVLLAARARRKFWKRVRSPICLNERTSRSR